MLHIVHLAKENITPLSYMEHGYTSPSIIQNARCGPQDIVQKCLKLHTINFS